MNQFWKYFFTIILAIIALNIVFKIIGVTLHFLLPLLILAGIVFLINKIWNGKPKRNHYDY
ncbi:hypothetical protein X560_1509 [Listeria fleischmannii 1991]|uniref:Uncharacterized protein n=4 Tax=Listeria fleischmannii TaxID=1069827 RepID=A0A2X3GVC9_9LIST|nr:hypothetical protein [Listeria fleischmannii]EIA19677.1 hypothetical protein KKC_11091 [Listeria fleischmannii subsp. coloradonensis]EMG27100.1 hypothetical protein LFLEISCH_12850 [Listeria fleischmannii subsp. fleischmannii LU2006-1]EUJ52735.1 hypothetical protein MCOL2_12639 [Listeria fleischmannii FSL S10-1203]KMT59955.1 hypothetical protein X560_1509 [Listeria fleischmannii 1991]MBC1398446.1 hypothetical protein [Listeria fleischmannii]